MIEEEKDFNVYMDDFKLLPLKEKQEIAIEQLQMLSGFTNNLCEEIKVKNDVIINRELIDVKKDEYTEDDFVEAVMVYVNSIQNSICDYAGGITDLLDQTLNETNEEE